MKIFGGCRTHETAQIRRGVSSRRWPRPGRAEIFALPSLLSLLALLALITASVYLTCMTSATLAKTAAEQIAKLRPADETADAFLEAVAENYIARELPRKAERARL